MAGRECVSHSPWSQNILISCLYEPSKLRAIDKDPHFGQKRIIFIQSVNKVVASNVSLKLIFNIRNVFQYAAVQNGFSRHTEKEPTQTSQSMLFEESFRQESKETFCQCCKLALNKVSFYANEQKQAPPIFKNLKMNILFLV